MQGLRAVNAPVAKLGKDHQQSTCEHVACNNIPRSVGVYRGTSIKQVGSCLVRVKDYNRLAEDVQKDQRAIFISPFSKGQPYFVWGELKKISDERKARWTRWILQSTTSRGKNRNNDQEAAYQGGNGTEVLRHLGGALRQTRGKQSSDVWRNTTGPAL